MTLQELKARLMKEAFRPGVYSIEGPLPAYEGLVLTKEGSQWKIEHYERGIRSELESFMSEERACDRMYELLAKHFR